MVLHRFHTRVPAFSRFIRWHVCGIRDGMHTPAVGQQQGTGALVLVVDDSPDARAMYGEYLRHSGFRVVTANNGEEALLAACAESPAVIVMDLAMPQMDGWEAIRELRANPTTSEIPIVALSAYAFANAPTRAREAGADLCLSKPCLPPQVARVVRAMVSRPSSQS
jgi:two-component system cell cycle response regulator DivK